MKCAVGSVVLTMVLVSSFCWRGDFFWLHRKRMPNFTHFTFYPASLPFKRGLVFATNFWIALELLNLNSYLEVLHYYKYY